MTSPIRIEESELMAFRDAQQADPMLKTLVAILLVALGCREHWLAWGQLRYQRAIGKDQCCSPGRIAVRLPMSWDSGKDSYCNHKIRCYQCNVIRLALCWNDILYHLVCSL